ncbi:hypothetical protein LCGC14_0543670 [marine sediment metagenome]|uniref:Uncharacterized protein n=1 Tax=marine sediment metagenome TaxID=412755 RepID=A0A0F9V0C0_9ZZZZ
MEHRWIKCPYCEHVFKITEKQITNNARFGCPQCKKHNAGSIETTPEGVLIGISKENAKFLYVRE